MANVYLSSVDGNDGTTPSVTWWNGSQATYATLNAALTAAGASGIVYVDNAHAQTQASALTVAASSGRLTPNRVICVNRSTGAATTGATVSTTGANNLTLSNYAYYYGIDFRAGDGANTARVTLSNVASVYEQCGFTLNNTSASSILVINGMSVCIDCVWTFGAVGQTITQNSSAVVLIQGGSFAGSAPTTLISISNATGLTRFTGVDLSNMGSGKTLIAGVAVTYSIVEMINCKLGASVTPIGGATMETIGGYGKLVNCDSADTNYRYALRTRGGDITQETTIVRSGGATDGTTAISRKMVSTANALFFMPLVSEPILVWNDTTGSSKTVTVEVVTDNVTLTDAEAWIEVEYLGTSGFPKSSVASDRAASFLATPANQTSSSVTWTTTGLGTPVKQALAVTFTPQEKGLFAIRVCLAKASTTVYFCPKADIS